MVALAAIVAMSVIGPLLASGRSQTIKVVNDTQEPWTVCGSDCRDNDPELSPRATARVHTKDGGEIFLQQDGRETGDCLFPSHEGASQTILISAKLSCVR